MSSNTLVRLALAVMMVAAFGLAGCAAPAEAPSTAPAPDAAAPTDPADPAEAPASEDAVFVEQKCTMCHTYERISSATYDQTGWEEVVTRMQTNGMVITDEEKARIIAFLAAQ